MLTTEVDSEMSKVVRESILAQWLHDSSRKAAFGKAVRAILATRGEQMMLDRPKGIYENSSAVKLKSSTTEDIWDGSLLLSHRIELLSMVRIAEDSLMIQIYDVSRMDPTFIKEEHYLNALLRRLLPLDHSSLSVFVAVASIAYRTESRISNPTVFALHYARLWLANYPPRLSRSLFN